MDSSAIYRSKIGSHLCYPVKFSELCTFLAPAIDRLKITVRFYAFFPPKQNEEQSHYRIIEASTAPGRAEGPWEIQIYPIPRSIRDAVRTVLLPELAGTVRTWLMKSEKNASHSPYRALRGEFDVCSEKVVFKEHNAP